MSQLRLMQALKFDTEDLRANREGRLSEAQRETYTPPKPNQMVVAVVFGHLLAVGGLLAVIAIFTGSVAMWVVMGIVTLLMFAPFGMVQQKDQIRPILRDDIARGHVEKVCGIPILTEKQGRKPYFELTIEGVTLRITPKQAEIFRVESLFCVYYLPGSKTLLSAEPSL